jgi:HEAT repeat protein
VRKRLFISFAVIGAIVLVANLVFKQQRKEVIFQGKTVNQWVKQVYAPDPKARQEALVAMKSIGSNAVPGLIKSLQAKDPLFRRTALWLASNLRARQAVLKKSPAPQAGLIHNAAARWLRELGPEARDAVPALAQTLRTDRDACWEAGMALGTIGKPALPHLVAALGDKDPNVRRIAATALELLGPDATSALGPLIKALDDEKDYVRLAAGSSLSRLGPTAVPVLTNALASGDAITRRRAAKGLACIPVARASAEFALLEMTHDKDTACREQAIRTLSVLGMPNRKMIESYIGALNDPSKEVRLAAVQALSNARWQAATVVPALMRSLADEFPAVREWAARVLGYFGPSSKAALPDLSRLAEDKEESVRLAAKVALDKIKGTDDSPSQIEN